MSAGQIGRSEAETRRRTSNDSASSDHGFLGAVLVTSGHAGPDHVAACLGAGADDVLGKPFTLAELVDRVRAAVRPPTVAEAG